MILRGPRHPAAGGGLRPKNEGMQAVRSARVGVSAANRVPTVGRMAVARYDAVADFYISGFNSTGDSVSLALLDLLGPVAGRRVLDVACEHGRITRELARRGADVTGIDISGKLIGKAREIEESDPLG